MAWDSLVAVACKRKRRKTGGGHRDPQLFVQFTDQSLFGVFARFDFAAGKFPQPCERFSLWTLSKKHTAIGIDERTGDNQNELLGPAASSAFIRHICTSVLTNRGQTAINPVASDAEKTSISCDNQR